MECFGTTDFDKNSRLITLSAIIISGLHCILIIFNISNIDKEVNKEIPEDDLIEDRNMLECFLKCFK